MSQTTISKALKELVGFGMVTYDKGSTRGRANLYHMQPEDKWRLPAPVSEAPDFNDRSNIRSSAAFENEATPLQDLKLNKTHKKRPIKEDQLSQEPMTITDYFKTLKPAAKSHSELQHYRTLRGDYSGEDIADCLKQLMAQGANGKPCHSPMAYLGKAIQQVHQDVAAERKKRRTHEDNEQRKVDAELYRQTQEEKAEQENLRIDEAFSRAFPSPEQQRVQLRTFSIDGMTNFLPEKIRVNIAKRKWWESLKQEE